MAMCYLPPKLHGFEKIINCALIKRAIPETLANRTMQPRETLFVALFLKLTFDYAFDPLLIFMMTALFGLDAGDCGNCINVFF